MACLQVTALKLQGRGTPRVLKLQGWGDGLPTNDSVEVAGVG